jgi:hypothetical protein
VFVAAAATFLIHTATRKQSLVAALAAAHPHIVTALAIAALTISNSQYYSVSVCVCKHATTAECHVTQFTLAVLLH